MPGLARTENEVLSSATVMLGARSELNGLNTLQHSIGLAKSFTMSTSPTFNNLTQGLTNEVVQSVMTAGGLSLSVEAYEFTAKNLAYVAGLDGSFTAGTTPTIDITTAVLAAAGTTVTIEGDQTSDYSAGDRVAIQNGTTDQVHVFEVEAVATNATNTDLTVAAAYVLPTGASSFPIGSRVMKMSTTSYGGTASQPTFSMKVVGVIPSTGTPIMLTLPKVRVTQGMSMSLSPDTWANMPMQFTPEALRVGEAFYSDFPSNKTMKVEVVS